MKKIILNLKRVAFTASALMIIQLGYQLFVNGSLKAYADTPTSTQAPACAQLDSSASTNEGIDQCQPPASDASDSTSADTAVAASSSNSQTATTYEGDTSSDPNDQTSETADDSSDPTVSSDQPNNNSPSPSNLGQTSSSSSSVAETGNADDGLSEVNSITSGSSAPATTISDNIDGNETGDVDVDPPSTTSGQLSNNVSSSVTTNSATTTANISNIDNITATSGSAYIDSTTSNNTASTGDASALASIVNLIGTLNDNQSYIESINISGNLDGNVLLPDQLANELISPSSTVIEATPEITNYSITNNISETASTGNALVTSDGINNSAISGISNNEIDITNYIDNVISGDNLWLVVVNVSGTIEGYILGQPASNGVYLIGTNITNNGTSNIAPATISNSSIENNINLTANTGSATIDSQYSESNMATTGNAYTGVDVANFEGSQFNLSGLFGILFINVFGNWDGSLLSYDNTATESTAIAPITTPPVTIAVFTAENSNPPKANVTGQVFFSNPNLGSSAVSLNSTKLAANVVKPSNKTSVIKSNAPDLTSSSNSDWLIAFAILPLIALFTIEKFINKRNG